MSGDFLGDYLSKRVRDLSYERGWTKEILAEKSTLPLETVKNIWYAKTPDPKTSTCVLLSEAFGITVNCLVGRCRHTPKEERF